MGCWALTRGVPRQVSTWREGVGRRHRTAQVIGTYQGTPEGNHLGRTSALAVDCYGQCCADVTQAVVGESPDPVNQHGD